MVNVKMQKMLSFFPRTHTKKGILVELEVAQKA